MKDWSFWLTLASGLFIIYASVTAPGTFKTVVLLLIAAGLIGKCVVTLTKRR